MRSGKLWVIGLLGLGGSMAGGAVFYWTRPETRVRWAFTQIHTQLVRGRPQVAANFVSAQVDFRGTVVTREQFLVQYKPDLHSGSIEVAACPSVPDHRTVALEDRLYCFVFEEKLWRLHWVGEGKCGCR
jgi:hypothetical protein